MKKIIIILTFISVLVLLVILNRSEIEVEPAVKDREKVDVTTTSAPETNEIVHNPISEQIASMSLDEKIGQLIIGGFDGTVVTDETKKLITTYKLGGFILFQRNLETAEQSISLLNELKRENKKNDIPLFLSVDQEGGSVSRLPELREMKTNDEIGQKKDKNFSYETGSTLARQLSAYGMNVNFAPVLDVNNNSDNIVIGNRSFGSDQEIVSSLGVQMMKGMQDENIIPVIKHFPGHGDTHIDSHESLPVISKGRDELDAVELLPFKDAIDAGADVVMTGHIHLPQLGTGFPATLSKEVITDLLRGQLDFDGVVITDDITMGAISNHYGLVEAAVLAIQSGVDIVLVAHEYENIVTIFNGLQEAVRTGEIEEDTIDESLARILHVKNKYELNHEKTTDLNVQYLNEDMRKLYEKYR